MEYRQELSFSHPLVWRDLIKRMRTYINGMLGTRTKENGQAYQKNLERVEQLLHTKTEYFVPKGSCCFSEEGNVRHPQAEEAGILAEVVVAFGVKDYFSEDMLDQYLMHLIQIASMNAARDYLSEQWVLQLYAYRMGTAPGKISPFFGPGLFDEPLDTMERMVSLAGTSAVGMAENGTYLKPKMAFVGVIYITEREAIAEQPCKHCKARIGCEYCMKRR